MKLNPDCVRDILLCVEENTGLHKSCYFIDKPMMEGTCAAMGEAPEPMPEYQNRLLQSYDNDTLYYHVLYCANAGLVIKLEGTATYIAIIEDLSVSGHEFINNARPTSIWELALKAFKSSGSFGFGIMQEAVSEISRKKTIRFLSKFIP